MSSFGLGTTLPSPELPPAGSGPRAPDDAHRAQRWRRPGRFLRDLNIVAVLLVVAASSALLLLPGTDDGLLGLPELAPGAEAPRTVKSPRAFVIEDPDTTERLEREAAEGVLPTYDLLLGLGSDAKARILDAFSAARIDEPDASPRTTEDELVQQHRDRLEAFMSGLGVRMERDALMPLVRADDDELRDAVVLVAQTIHEKRIAEDKSLLQLQAPEGLRLRLVNSDGTADHEEQIVDYTAIIGIDEARVLVDELVAEKLKRFPGEQRRAVAVLVKRLLRPNLEANRLETLRRREAARNAVKTVLVPIEPGETVLRQGERVTERHLVVLRGMERELRGRSRVQAAAGAALITLSLIILAYRFTTRSHRSFRPSHRDLAFMGTVYVTLLLGTWLSYKGVIWLGEALPNIPVSAHRFLLPVSAGALLLRLALGPRATAAFIPVAGLTVGWMMDSNLGFAAYAIAGSLAAALFQSLEHPRRAILGAGARAGLAQACVVVALSLLDSNVVISTAAAEACAAFASGILAAILVLLAVPAVEVLFGYTTAMKLTDLSDMNHPLLRELLIEAPGTYHHSIMVGTLARAGAKAIGADPLLALVGAYFHDVGKIANPRAFEENSPPDVSPFSPNEASSEIRAHVADGLERAAKHRVGQQVLEIIAQHHGTSPIRLHVPTALELSGASARGNELSAPLRYAGPKPLTPAAALVLMADATEVAARGLSTFTSVDAEAIERVVKRTIADLLEDGQLDESMLTLGDVAAVGDAFVEVLEDRLLRRSRPTLSHLPGTGSARVVRPPARGEVN